MIEHQLFLSLGGNLGNKSNIFTKTADMVEERIGHRVKISSLYESPAWGFRSARLFWNQVLKVETRLSPVEILKEIRKIEEDFGRKREYGRYLSRKMDIDILFYDDLITETEELTIPHPYIAQRKFILLPLSEIAPDFIHPVLHQKITRLYLECPDTSQIRKI